MTFGRPIYGSLQALAPIGVLMPWFMVFAWEFIVLDEGTAALRLASMSEKSLYLGLSVIAPGALTLLSWQALLVDCRDALILGSLPIASSTVMRAKVLAIRAGRWPLPVGMHAAGSPVSRCFFQVEVPSVFWSVAWSHILSRPAWRVVSRSARLRRCRVARSRSLALACSDEYRRCFKWASRARFRPAVVTSPSMSGNVVDAMSASSPERSWVLFLPPVWFLGVERVAAGHRR